MRKQINKLFKRSARPFKRLGQWARKPARRIRRARRYRALARWAEARRNKLPAHSKKRAAWAERRKQFNEKAREIELEVAENAGPYEIIPRAAWDDNPSDRARTPMQNESSGLFVHHTVAGRPSTQEGEKAEMRNLKRIGRSRGFSDISYSFIVFESGRIYEARGRGIAGAHTLNYNSTSHGASAAGNYDTTVPSEAMVDAFQWLAQDYLSASRVRGHREVYSTACPGQHLHGKVKA